MQTACLRHMGKKLLVALTMKASLPTKDCKTIDEDDVLSAMAENSSRETGSEKPQTLSGRHPLITLRAPTCLPPLSQ